MSSETWTSHEVFHVLISVLGLKGLQSPKYLHLVGLLLHLKLT